MGANLIMLLFNSPEIVANSCANGAEPADSLALTGFALPLFGILACE